MTRSRTLVLAVVLLVVGIGSGIGIGLVVSGQMGAPIGAVTSPSADASQTQAPTADPSQDPGTPSPEPTASPSPTPTPEPTPTPGPSLYPAILDGVPVIEKVATRHVIAVMIDDQSAARPQSGLSQASVVWQAPAEGGIPRYMALFHEGNAPAIGPIRSSRLYFVAWAAEWNAVYVHAGGSAEAIAYLATSAGRGEQVWNGDGLRSSGQAYVWRISSRFAPHNLYSDGKHLRAMGSRLGAKAYEEIPTPVWTFEADPVLEDRLAGAKLSVPYPANLIQYVYDRKRNAWNRSVTGEGKQVDAGTDVRIAPKNVVVMYVPFLPTGDKKHHLDGQVTGSGVALFAVNGQIVKGTWSKKSFAAHTFFFGPDGKPMVFAIGQTFIQVVPKGTTVTWNQGKVAPSPTPTPNPSATPTPAP